MPEDSRTDLDLLGMIFSLWQSGSILNGVSCRFYFNLHLFHINNGMWSCKILIDTMNTDDIFKKI